MIKVDLHVHTRYSMDCKTSLEDIYNECKRKGISKIAVTDHETIEGALKFNKLYPDLVIVGEEILSSHGEIIGLFIHKHIESRQSPEKVIEEIKRQGGLVYIPHPFDVFRAGLKEEKLRALIDKIDIIEIFNSKCVFGYMNRKARKFAEKFGKYFGAGSDSHNAKEVGKSVVLMEDFADKEEFLRNLKNAKIEGKRSSLFQVLLPIKVRIEGWLSRLFRRE